MIFRQKIKLKRTHFHNIEINHRELHKMICSECLNRRRSNTNYIKIDAFDLTMQFFLFSILQTIKVSRNLFFSVCKPFSL